MRPNQLKNLWQNGDAAINAWLTIPSAFTAELMAHQQFDSLTIDMQHGLMGYDTAVAMLQAISTTAATPLVRVPWNDPGDIMRMLDAGAYGIICPMINSRAEAEQFVRAVRYPPHGQRSYGPVRARLYAGDDYVAHANNTILAFAMIETAEALARVDEIVSTPGLDAIYVGPADLSFSLTGRVQSDYTDPDLLGALDTIVAACRRHNVVAGMHTSSTAFALRMISRGFQFVTILADATYLEKAAADIVATMRRGSEGQSETGP